MPGKGLRPSGPPVICQAAGTSRVSARRAHSREARQGRLRLSGRATTGNGCTGTSAGLVRVKGKKGGKTAPTSTGAAAASVKVVGLGLKGTRPTGR